MWHSVGLRAVRATGVAVCALLLWTLLPGDCSSFAAEEPPTINPFGPRPSDKPAGYPGYVETSDGKVHPGLIYMTRDKRLKMFDEKLQRQREIPLRVVKQIECTVQKEWMEKEWKFKELALDEKMYTGHSYPSREYVHTITLKDDRTISGPLAEIIYVKPYIEKAAPGSKAYRPETSAKPQRFLLHKRDKGEIDTTLKSLHYVKLVKLGEEALKEGQRKAGRRVPRSPRSKSRTGAERSRDRGR